MALLTLFLATAGAVNNLVALTAAFDPECHFMLYVMSSKDADETYTSRMIVWGDES